MLATATERPPNFVVIFADDLGYEDVGCFGSPAIRTPRLDAMAREGMRFTSFYAQPICGPSRASIMTGCYPLRVAERGNVKQVHPILHSDEITIAEVLKQEGYATGCFGKWDLAKHAQTGFFPDLFPTHQGFDYFFGTPTSNDRVVNLYRNEELIEPKADMAPLTERYTDEAIQFMRNHREKPFFVYLPHTMPHTRLDATPKFKGKSKRGLYGDVVEEIDHNSGRILDAIQEMGLAEHTYVLFTSDNGPWLIKNKDLADGHLPQDHGGSAGPLRSGKVSTFEGGVRVPAILWGPGRVPAGTTCDSIASTLDLLPTFVALAGTEAPKDGVIDGEDIRHLFHGQFDQANPDKAFFYYLRVQLQAVRQGKWKLHLPRSAQPVVVAPFSVNQHIAPADRVGFEEPFLVDLEADLGETTNVAAQHPDVVKQLLDLAESMREDLGDFDRVGKNMRFFDPIDPRPNKPPVPPARRPRKKKVSSAGSQKRPNILVLMGDDWSYPHASALGDPFVQTPTFDRLAREGVLFRNAFVSAPSCTPSRHAIASGQYHWRLGNGANLGGSIPKKTPVYPDLLAEAGYVTGFSRKGTAPSKHTYRGNDPFGAKFKSFEEFYAKRPRGKPFCIWYGAGEPHRPYDWQASKRAGMNLAAIQVPACLPDNETIRTDLGDYYLPGATIRSRRGTNDRAAGEKRRIGQHDHHHERR